MNTLETPICRHHRWRRFFPLNGDVNSLDLRKHWAYTEDCGPVSGAKFLNKEFLVKLKSTNVICHCVTTNQNYFSIKAYVHLKNLEIWMS